MWCRSDFHDADFGKKLWSIDAANAYALLTAHVGNSSRAGLPLIRDDGPSEHLGRGNQPRVGRIWISGACEIK